MSDVICKVCGHDGDDHRFAIPVPDCRRCPDGKCQLRQKWTEVRS